MMKSVFFRNRKDDPYSQYKKDTAFEVVWAWEYRRKAPYGMMCKCPQCGSDLFYDEHRSGNHEGVEVALECESCDLVLNTIDGTYMSLLKRVQSHIERKIATGDWR